jgi:hypothetical protein
VAGKLTLHFDSRVDDRMVEIDRVLHIDRTIDIPASGEFEVPKLTLGAWTATCRVPGYVTAQAHIVLASDEERVRHDFELEPRRLVRVTLHDADGHPLIEKLARDGSKLGDSLGALVCLAEPVLGESPCANSENVVHRTRIVGKGDADPWCEMEIEIDPSSVLWVCLALGDRTLAFKDVQPGEEDITLVVSANLVRGALGSAEITVVDDWSSLPLENASVGARQSHGSTDAHGRVRFDGLLPGDARISAAEKDHVVRSSLVSISAGEVARSEIRLEPSVTITGTLKNDLGERKSGYVQMISLTGDRSITHGARAMADGSFTIYGLAHGEYVLVDSSANVPQSTVALLDKQSLQDGMVYVDARKGSVSNVVVGGGHIESTKATANRTAK